jgi:hypothetical protein
MATSEARILANQKNALLSTGPKTSEGKDRSRANALKHGLCSTVLVTEDLESIKRRADEWYYALKPQNPHQAWLVDQVAVHSLRIDRSERIERRLRDRAMLRAEIAWDDDRMIEVESIGSKLGRRPSEVTRQLRATPHGCDWLIARWKFLETSAKGGAWTAEQTRLAFDLLGTPLEAREGRRPGDLVDADGKVLEPAEAAAEVARRELQALAERRERVADLDEADRALVAADQLDSTNAELKKLRRYENTLHGRVRWFIAQIREPSPHPRTDPTFKPRWFDKIPVEAAPPESPPETEITPSPTNLEPDKVPPEDQAPDTSPLLIARRQKKVRKAEARREARRRKVEKLRA